MRQFIEVTELHNGQRLMIGMAHIVRIEQTSADGELVCRLLLADGQPVFIKESYARIAAILGGMPTDIVDMMAEEDDRWR